MKFYGLTILCSTFHVDRMYVCCVHRQYRTVQSVGECKASRNQASSRVAMN